VRDYHVYRLESMGPVGTARTCICLALNLQCLALSELVKCLIYGGEGGRGRGGGVPRQGLQHMVFDKPNILGLL
jgi:hypothetical protein